MQSSDYLKSGLVKKYIDEIISNVKNDDLTDTQLEDLIAGILLESFNDGIISNMTERTKLSNETIRKKSKNITTFLPAHFKETETGQRLVEVLQNEIVANTKDYVLNVGYEPILEDTINKVLQVAYSVGVTTGFEIAADPDMKSIYTSNVERFMKSGIPGNN